MRMMQRKEMKRMRVRTSMILMKVSCQKQACVSCSTIYWTAAAPTCLPDGQMPLQMMKMKRDFWNRY